MKMHKQNKSTQLFEDGDKHLRIFCFDLLRVLSTIFVFIAHFQNRFFTSIYAPGSDEPNTFRLAIAFFSGFGHHALIIFFVMSGFLVGGSSLKQAMRRDFSLQDYFLRRITRLYAVLVPVLIICLVMNNFLLELIPLPESDLLIGIREDSGFAVLGCNLLFLQTLACKPFGGNGALWTLCHEFWYYMILGLICWSINERNNFANVIAAVAILSILIMFCLYQFEGLPFISYSLVWFIGVTFSCIEPKSATTYRPRDVILYITTIVSIRILIREHGQFSPTQHIVFLSDVISALLLANMLKNLGRHQTNSNPFPSRIITKFATVTYSFYSIHTPIINLFLIYISSYHNDYHSELQVFVLCCIFTYFMSIVFYRAFESQTDNLRKLVRKMLHLRSSKLGKV